MRPASGKQVIIIGFIVVLTVLFIVTTSILQRKEHFRYRHVATEKSHEDESDVAREKSKEDESNTQRWSVSQDSSPDPSNPLQPSDKHQVLLVTYARSGSSFTGALISYHKNIFYSYEPLHILQKNPEFFKYREDPKSTSRPVASMDIINSYLSCRFTQDYVASLLNYHSGQNSYAGAAKACLTDQLSGVEHVSCYLKFLEACQSYSVTFAKTIRFRVQWAEWFLQHNPNFKLLYLIRDPRPTLFSEVRAFRLFNWINDIDEASRQHCSTVEEDLAATERFMKLYPGRAKGIRYEDGAVDPISYTQKIYKFLGLEYDDSVTKYVLKLTNQTSRFNADQVSHTVVYANSTQVMNGWRQKVGFQQVKVIDENCGYLYSRLGYRTVASEQELGSEKSLLKAPDPIGVF